MKRVATINARDYDQNPIDENGRTYWNPGVLHHVITELANTPVTLLSHDRDENVALSGVRLVGVVDGNFHTNAQLEVQDPVTGRSWDMDFDTLGEVIIPSENDDIREAVRARLSSDENTIRRYLCSKRAGLKGRWIFNHEARVIGVVVVGDHPRDNRHFTVTREQIKGGFFPTSL